LRCSGAAPVPPVAANDAAEPGSHWRLYRASRARSVKGRKDRWNIFLRKIFVSLVNDHRVQVSHVGTAGWAIPPAHRETLPGSGSHLERYAQRLNAAEINSSFHRHHRVQTYMRWASSVPASFRFSVKMPRELSHSGKLAPESEGLDRFVDEIRGLDQKLGVLLLQLPPKLVFDESSARNFFRSLGKRTNVPLACEPRHPSWGSTRADGVLAQCAVARVAADPARWPGAGEPGGDRGLAYFRWHGQPRIYYSDYNADQLESLRQQVERAGERASEVWIIFDNTVLGCALGNALAVRQAMPT
jgi:uncharacterized protein YecE (DUF72 family)